MSETAATVRLGCDMFGTRKEMQIGCRLLRAAIEGTLVVSGRKMDAWLVERSGVHEREDSVVTMVDR